MRLPAGRSVVRYVPAGIALADGAAMCGALIEQPCGGLGQCGGCRIRFIKGAPPPIPEEVAWLGEPAVRAGWRLACRRCVTNDATLELDADLLWTTQKDFGGAEPLPVTERRFVRRAVDLGEGTAAEWRSRDDALRAALAATGCESLVVSDTVLRRLGALPARALSALDVWTLDSERVIAALPRGAAPAYALACDLGTTTLACALVDLESGAVRATCTELNPQTRFGADVMSRIAFAATDRTAALRRTLLHAIENMTLRLCRQSTVDVGQILAAGFVGNAFMLHSLCGVSPQSLGAAPFCPVWTRPLVLDGAALGVPALSHATVIVMPLLGGHVGADAAAAVIATDLDRTTTPSLLIDLGTNCEIVLATGDRIFATSAAAGPAFEGGNISCGMRATRGAVDRVGLDASGELWLHTIGEAPPKGICGAGLVDLVALLLDSGLIDATGRLAPRASAPQCDRHDRLAARMTCGPSGEARFTLVPSSAHPGVYLTAADVRQLQLVKGSIRAAIELLLDEAALAPEQLESIAIAGQLGMYLRKSSVLRVGLLPTVAPQKIRFVGNAAAAGCRGALADTEAWRRICLLHEDVRHIELASHRDYEERFVFALHFPAA
jgi:uncharacterized 2Fe-2S/4Fe-4S cluster protein (DUF4445 family)